MPHPKDLSSDVTPHPKESSMLKFKPSVLPINTEIK